MYIIESKKKGLRALSGTQRDPDYHNRIFDTDDCTVTQEADPTPEAIAALRIQTVRDLAAAKSQAKAEAAQEAIIQARVRQQATALLVKEGVAVGGELVEGEAR
jgi:hypothetical protein